MAVVVDRVTENIERHSTTDGQRMFHGVFNSWIRPVSLPGLPGLPIDCKSFQWRIHRGDGGVPKILEKYIFFYFLTAWLIQQGLTSH